MPQRLQHGRAATKKRLINHEAHEGHEEFKRTKT